MPAYKYQMKNGKTKWYANFYYTDWLGQKQHKCKRGFDTRREAQEWERNFLDSTSKDPTITQCGTDEEYSVRSSSCNLHAGNHGFRSVSQSCAIVDDR